MLNPYFYSLEMLVTSRAHSDCPYLSAMDVLAWCIADEEREPPQKIAFLFKPPCVSTGPTDF
jgi:hypothetical protein